MKEYTFRYGEGEVSLTLDEKQVIGELAGNTTPPLTDISAAVFESLDHPIDSPHLTELIPPEGRVTLIVSDMSRFWMRQDLVVPHVVRYLNERCHLRDDQMTILIANGTHPGGDEEELKTLVTPEIYDRIRVVNHDCLRDEDMVTLGTTPHGTTVRVNRLAAESDLTLCIGSATHHVMAGYGGGRKSILPGVAAMDTICQNHRWALDPEKLRSNPKIGNGVLEGNPFNEDLCEAAALLPHLFMVNLVMNEEMKLSSLFCGHWMNSWLKACEEVNRIYTVPIPERADVVVAGCGGFPKDMSLYQGTKTIDNIETALKPGGTLILIIEAREGGGPEEYFGWIRNWVDGTMNRRIREHFTVPGYIFLLNCEQAMRYRVLMLTSVKPDVVAPMGIEAYSDPEELLRAANIGNKRMYVIRNGSTVIPRVPEEQ